MFSRYLCHPPGGGPDANFGRPCTLIHNLPCRTPCRLFQPRTFLWTFRSSPPSELGRSPPFRPMRSLTLPWSRAFTLVCEVALTHTFTTADPNPCLLDSLLVFFCYIKTCLFSLLLAPRYALMCVCPCFSYPVIPKTSTDNFSYPCCITKRIPGTNNTYCYHNHDASPWTIFTSGSGVLPSPDAAPRLWFLRNTSILLGLPSLLALACYFRWWNFHFRHWKDDNEFKVFLAQIKQILNNNGRE